MEKRKWIVLFIVVLMSFMSCIDSSIVNIALPVMSKKLSVTMASIEWVVASYLLAICSTLLIFGRLGDIIGKIKVFKFGMILFTIGSFMCGFSTSLGMLILFRVIQGIGASAYMANNQGIITQIFEKKERGKALGILAAAVALGTMIGPPAGGIIISAFSWKYIFLVNVPIGVAAYLAAIKILPKDKSSNEKLDIKGAVLFFLSSVLLFSAAIQEQKVGINNSIIIVGFILAVVFTTMFIIMELRVKTPLLQLQIFKNKLFSLSLICALISFVCLSASLIIIPFYLEDTLKISSSYAGIFMMISPLIVAIISPLAGTLSDKTGSEILTFLGLICMSIGFLVMSLLKQNSSLILMAVFVAIIAIGQGLFQPANNSLIMSNAPKDKLGVAGSVNSLVRIVGQIVGVTLATTLLYNFMSIKAGFRVTDYVSGRDDIFIFAMKYVYIILSITCIIGAVCTIIRLYKNKKLSK